MISKEEILKYYKSDVFLPELPSDSRFRHYRGINIKGGWRKCPRKIKTPLQLKEWFIKEKLTDVWYSTSLWLDPRNITNRNPKMISEQILLGSDLAIEIDESFSIQGLRKAWNNIKKIYKVFSKKYKLKYLEFTGAKGFRLVFDYFISLPKDPRERISFLEREKRKIYKDALLLNILDIKVDKDCLIDGYRIIRIINTINSKSGLICRKLPKSALSKSFEDIRKYMIFPNGKKGPIPRIPIKKDKKMTGDEDNHTRISPRLISESRDGFGIASGSSFDAIFITNQIGINRFVPFFKWPKNIGYKRKLKKVYEVYHLGPIWVFEDEDYIWAYGIRTYQKRRLKKVYTASKSLLTKQFKKYHRNYFQVIPGLRFKEKLNFKTRSYCSKAHYGYLVLRGIEDAGKCKLKFHKATILKLTKVKYKRG